MGLAREWSEEAARLRALSKDLWILWYLLLLGDSNAEIGAQLCWSQRTIERRLTQLYVLLGVQSRSEAVTLAWKWNLIHAYQSGLAWSSVILDMFPAEYAGLGTKEFGV